MALMALTDQEYTAHPFQGSRRMTTWLQGQGYPVNRKGVQCLLRLMCLEAVYPKPRLSVAGAGHKVYPYLLRGVAIERVNRDHRHSPGRRIGLCGENGENAEATQEEVTVAREEEKLKLGKDAAFLKSRLKRLRQKDETWEADFQPLPKPITQSQTHYLGMVVAPDGAFVADTHVEGRPTVNDMATLLATAMRRPLTGKAHRPHRLHVRGHPQWRELFPHLDELGINVAVHRELPKVQHTYQGYLRKMREAHRTGMVKPSAEQQSVEKLFPATAKWVQGYGHIEIGDQESFGFVVRALDYGGLVFEDDKADTLPEALAALEKGLAGWFKNEGVEL